MRARPPRIRSAPPSTRTRAPTRPLAVQAAASVLSAWGVIRRALRPVRAIRAELDAINVSGLSARVREPPGRGEITRLTRTINIALQRLEDAKRQLARTDERQQRSLDQQRRFAADASHELRTPLTGLRTQLEEAQLHPDDTDLGHLLDHALGDVDRLEAIIADLFLLTMIDRNAPLVLEEIDLAELVHAEVPRRMGDPHPVRTHLETGVRVDVDRTLISRVLANLIDNAQRHAVRAVRVQLHRSDGSAELTITDDGVGIAEGDRERIFHRFTRLDTARSREHGGTGLGLALARGIARSHNGTLHAESPPDDGARFVLRLPLAPPPDRGDVGRRRR
jgi:signal transduction histidine kinase